MSNLLSLCRSSLVKPLSVRLSARPRSHHACVRADTLLKIAARFSYAVESPGSWVTVGYPPSKVEEYFFRGSVLSLFAFQEGTHDHQGRGECQLHHHPSRRLPPGSASCHGVLGGSRYNVSAKVAYTISTNTPTNHADWPLVVTSEAVSVAISIMATAPGQICKVIGCGPIR
jgi:hypothetical protein